MLYIIRSNYFMENYIFSVLENRKDICMIKIENKKPHGFNKFRFLITRHLLAFFRKKRGGEEIVYTENFLAKIKNIKSEDSVLVFNKNLKNILILHKLISSKKFSVCIWDSFCTKSFFGKIEYYYHIHRNNIKLYTIDNGDAERYKFVYTKQFYRDYNNEFTALKNPDLQTDLFFVGQDKNRAEKLLELINNIKKYGLKYNFFILKDKHSKHLQGLKECYIQNEISYDEVLKYIANCKCLVEIVQKGQSGLTLRALEALFFRKKLITNNKNIINEEFYHSNNIYILGYDDSKRSIQDFLQSDIYSVPDSIMDIYRVETFLKQFI